MLKFLSKMINSEETKIQIKYIFKGLNLIDSKGNKECKSYVSSVDQDCSSSEMIKLVFDEIEADVNLSIRVVLKNQPPVDTQVIPEISIAMTGTLQGKKVRVNFTSIDSFREYLKREAILSIERQNAPN